MLRLAHRPGRQARGTECERKLAGRITDGFSSEKPTEPQSDQEHARALEPSAITEGRRDNLR